MDRLQFYTYSINSADVAYLDEKDNLIWVKPCSFCGASGHLIKVYDKDVVVSYTVQCSSCFSEVLPTKEYNKGWSDPIIALLAWNDSSNQQLRMETEKWNKD